MFRNFLSLTNPNTQLELAWVKKIEGLLRVVICDPSSNRAFVIVYYEKKREYAMIAFDMLTGEFCWTKNVVNGGYGTPAIVEDLIIIPTQFTNIIALSKKDGRKVWELKTPWRLRSSINVVGNKIYFSSGGTLYEVAPNGCVTNQWSFPGAFFYGSVDPLQDLVISLGTVEDKSEESTANVFAFHKSGEIAYVLPISRAPVISSDTSGVAWQGDIGFVGGNNIIKSFQGSNGQSIWTTSVDGFAGRQICSVDRNRVYYTTQSGIVGALNASDGSHAWSIKTRDKTIVSPISIINDHLVVLADAHLNVLKSDTGQLIKKTPVGHAPYGMLSLSGDYGFLGAGEPPHNGLLFAFKLVNRANCENYTCYAQSSNAFVEANFADILINVENTKKEVLSLRLDGSIFNINELILGEKVGASTFAFRVPIPKTMNSGDFVIPSYLDIGSQECLSRPVLISLQKRNSFPTRVHLTQIPDITQEKPTYSGAAIGVAIKSMYGDGNISQTDMRSMVDFSLDRSGYEPFQTWRIILRRILSSSATQKEELSEFHSNRVD